MAIELSSYSFLGKLAIKHIIIALFIISYFTYLVLLFSSYIYKRRKLDFNAFFLYLDLIG